MGRSSNAKWKRRTWRYREVLDDSARRLYRRLFGRHRKFKV